LPILNLGDTTEISSALTFTSIFFLSILNALIYLRTKNLYIAIGLHALWFNPAFVITPALPHTFVLVILAIVFILLWPLLPNSPSLMSTWPLQNRRPT
jgi:membrane protease YdiL (CAAX protease family)